MLVLQGVRHIAVDDALRQALDDGGFPDAGFTDQDRVVLRTPRQHLHHTADFFVTPDDGIELALARDFGEIASEALQRLVLALWLLIGDAMGAAHSLERRQQVFAAYALGREQLARAGTLLFGEREQQVLGRDIGITQRLRVLIRAVEHARQLARQRRLDAATGLLGEALDLALGFGLKLRDVEPGLLQQRHDDAFLLLQEGVEQMRIVDDRIASRPSQRSGLLERLSGLDGQSFWLDHALALGNGCAGERCRSGRQGGRGGNKKGGTV